MLVGQLHFAEDTAGDARDAVVPGEPIVDERIVGVEEFEDAAVLAHDVVEEQLCLANHRRTEVRVEFVNVRGPASCVASVRSMSH